MVQFQLIHGLMWEDEFGEDGMPTSYKFESIQPRLEPVDIEATDTRDIKSLETTVNETNAYDLEIVSISSWFTDVTYEGISSNEMTYYYILDENENIVGIYEPGEREFIETSEIEDNTYTPSQNPEYFRFISLADRQTNGETGLINCLFHLALQNEGINYIDCSVSSMNINRSNIKKYELITEIETSITSGIGRGIIITDRFMELLKENDGTPRKYKDVYGGETAVGEMLVNGDRALFQFLDTAYTENRICNTVGLSTVMRAILQAYTGNDYGITDLEYEASGNMSDMPSAIVGNTIQEKVWIALKSLGYSDISVAAAMGNIHYESGTFNPNAIERGFDEYTGGIGICQWTNNNRGTEGRNADLRAYAQSKGTTWQDEDTQVEFLVAELSGGGLNGYADNQWFTPTYTQRDYNPDDWENAEDTEELDTNKLRELVEIFCFCFERPNEQAGLRSMDARYSYALDYYERFHNSLGGGTYTEVGSNGIIGYFTSNITGRTFTIFKQSHTYTVNGESFDLTGQCNRGVAASIASGYKVGTETDMDVIYKVKHAGNNIFTNVRSTRDFFSQYGLEVAMDQYDYSMDNMRNILMQGKYIAIWFRGNVVGRSGATYSGGRNGIHWIGIIGYRNENGQEQIFISDPGWGSSGWKNIDEFEDNISKIVHFHTIYETQ